MCHGCNIGAYTMSKLVKNVSYDKIKKITDWQLNDEKLRKGLSWVVNALSKLTVSKNWGEGKTSSGDVHLVRFREKVLQQSYNLKFGDYALEFYTFVADNYAPYHSNTVESAGGEAAHALDGIYYNESDLIFEEHYTDTKAAATINFAAFAFTGVEYNPRIRGIQNHKIFKIEREKDYGN
jgi:TnpA family transposase